MAKPMTHKEVDEFYAQKQKERSSGKKAKKPSADEVRNAKAAALRKKAEPYTGMSKLIKVLGEKQ